MKTEKRTTTTKKQKPQPPQQIGLFGSGKGWITEAIAALHLYIAQRKREAGEAQFTFDQFRAWADENRMIEQPAHVNAWGTLPRAAVREKLVEWTGAVAAASRSASHGRLVKVWRAM